MVHYGQFNLQSIAYEIKKHRKLVGDIYLMGKGMLASKAKIFLNVAYVVRNSDEYASPSTNS